MIAPSLTKNEPARVSALRDLNILDTLPEKEYDEITRLASYICQTPISLISLIDENRQWFKSKWNMEINEAPREYSFCGHAILDPENIMEIPDARKDERFKDNPFTLSDPPILFYSGVPLVDNKGHALGTLCVVDNVPRKLKDDQKDALKVLGKQVGRLLELRNRNEQLQRVRERLKARNENLKNFARTVSHDMKMPLANIILTIDVLKKKYGESLDEKALEYLNNLKYSSFSLSDYISGILENYESDDALNSLHEKFDLHDLLENIIDLLNITEDCEINLPKRNRELDCNKNALEQILLNLINNSLKYNDKERIVIDIKCKEKDGFYQFKIKDNGIGIPRDKQAEIFDLFASMGHDRKGQKGHGIGLSTVKKLVEKLGGEIRVSSKLGKSTTFRFTIKKWPATH